MNFIDPRLHDGLEPDHRPKSWLRKLLAPKVLIFTGVLCAALIMLVATAVHALPHLMLLGLAIALGGFACGLTMKNVLKSQPLFVRFVMALLFVGCAMTAWICFQAPGFLVLLPGITVAFAAGQIAGMFVRAFYDFIR